MAADTRNRPTSTRSGDQRTSGRTSHGGSVRQPARPAGAAHRPVLVAPARRLRGGLLVVVALLALLAGRLVFLQAIGGDAYAAGADIQRVVKSPLLAQRGDITDRNGQPLSSTIAGRLVFGEPKAIAKAECKAGGKISCTPAEIAAKLAPVLGVPAAGLAERLSDTDRGYVVLANDQSPQVGKQVRELNLLGIGTEAAPQRTHPGGDLAANIIGFTDSESQGAGGIELSYNTLLTGKDGSSVEEVDNDGRRIPSATQKRTEPVPGTSVRLTIDRDLQWYAQQQLAAKVAETQALNGSAVVLDVKTGQVLALATAPTFDANNPGASPAEDRGNPAISQIYDPGSVNKVITVGTAIEAGLVAPDTVLTVPQSQRFGSKTITDSHKHPTEPLTVNGIMIQSSNVGTVQIAEKLGPQRLYDGMKNFGYAAPTGLGLPGESQGLIPEPQNWSGSSLPTIAIGQGVSVNAIQVASVYQTVANGGVRVQPSIVAGTVAPDGAVTPSQAPEERRVVSEATADALLPMLEGVVSASGTAPKAAIPGYRVGGKTGTSDYYSDVLNGYDFGKHTSSFTGFAPADAPRLVTAVVLQGTGKAGYYGGSTAGPVFKDIMSFALQSERVPPTGASFVVPRIYGDGR